jgi:hypothetical protein
MKPYETIKTIRYMPELYCAHEHVGAGMSPPKELLSDFGLIS